MRDVPRERHLVGRHQDRRAVASELPHELEHLADELRVERARDLVEQQHLGVGRDRADDRGALLLPAGQAVRMLARLLGETDAFQQPHPGRLGRRPRHLLHLAARERHVVEHGQVREQVVVLEHDAESCADGVGLDRGSLMSWSPSQIWPSSMGSSRLRQRSSVDLPEPLAPMSATTSCRASSTETPRSTGRLAERLPDLLGPEHGTPLTALIRSPRPARGGAAGPSTSR